MKIAIFSDVYLDVPGGIVSSINAQKEGLEKAGHEVVIFSPGFAGRKREPGVYVVPTCKVLRLNKAPVAHRPGIVEKWILKQFPDFGKEFDLVHVHYEAGCSIAGMRLAKKYGITTRRFGFGGKYTTSIQNARRNAFKLVSFLVLTA